MTIRQLNASYVLEEDRVLLRFTTGSQEEYRLWLTRATVATLLLQTRALAVEALEQNVSESQARVVEQFNQQTLQQTVTFTQFEGATHFPLGPVPVLIRSVQAQRLENASVLVWALSQGQNLTLNLNEDLLGKLQFLLQKMNEAARWSIAPLDATQVSAAAQDANPDPVDDSDNVRPPQVFH